MYCVTDWHIAGKDKKIGETTFVSENYLFSFSTDYSLLIIKKNDLRSGGVKHSPDGMQSWVTLKMLKRRWIRPTNYLISNPSLEPQLWRRRFLSCCMRSYNKNLREIRKKTLKALKAIISLKYSMKLFDYINSNYEETAVGTSSYF